MASAAHNARRQPSSARKPRAANRNAPGLQVYKHGEAAFRNTANEVPAEEWADAQLRQDALVAQTNRLANILENFDIRSRLDSDLCVLPTVTDSEPCFLEAFRPIRFLPTIAQRDRRPMLNALKHYQLHHKDGRYWRYGVVSSGQRVPVYGDVRGRTRKLHRKVSKASSEVKALYGIEYLSRVTEWTIDEMLTFNVHANLVYVPPAGGLSEARWGEFLGYSHDHYGTQWRDCGVLQDPAEVLKYPFKPADVEILADSAAHFVEAWRDRKVTETMLKTKFQHMVMESMSKVAISKGLDPEISPSDPEVLERVEKAYENARLKMTAAYERGDDHPIVWLYKEVSRHVGDDGVMKGGLKLAQPLNSFKTYRGELDRQRLKVASVVTHEMSEATEVGEPSGVQKKTILSLVEKPHKKAREIDPDKEPTEPTGPAENIVLTVGLPQPRWCPFAEPVVYVMGYTERPTTDRGREGLSLIAHYRDMARHWWTLQGGPDPRSAVLAGEAALIAAKLKKQERSDAEGGASILPFSLDTVRSTVPGTVHSPRANVDRDDLGLMTEGFGETPRQAILGNDGHLFLGNTEMLVATDPLVADGVADIERAAELRARIWAIPADEIDGDDIDVRHMMIAELGRNRVRNARNSGAEYAPPDFSKLRIWNTVNELGGGT